MRRSTKIKLERLLYSKLSIIGGFFVLALIIASFARAIFHDRAIRNEIKRMEDEMAILETEQNNSKSLITYLKSDMFLEKEARKNFGYVRPGEQVVVIERSEPKEVIKEKERTNPEKWFVYFFQSEQ